MATPTAPQPPTPTAASYQQPKVDDFYRNIAQRLLDVHSAESVVPAEPTKVTVGDQTITLPGTTFGSARLSWDVYQSAQARALREAYSVPVGRAYGPDGKPLDWDYRKEVVGPVGQPLPPGATSWDKYGRPYYGNNDFSIRGDLKSEFMATFARFGQPSRDTEFNAFSKDFWEIFAAAEKESAVTGKSGEGFGLLVGETAKFFTQAFARAQQMQTAVEPVDTVISGLSKFLTATMRSIINGFQAGAISWERTYGTTLLINQALAEKSSMPDLPRLGGWFSQPQAISTPQVFWNGIRAAQTAISLRDAEEWQGITRDAGQASRITYTLAYDRAKWEAFRERLHDGEDPRLLAIELEDPVMEAIGQTFNDPFIILGVVGRALRGGSAAVTAAKAGNASRWSTAADNAFVGAIKTFDGTAGEVGRVVRSAADDIAEAGSEISRRAAATGVGSERLTPRLRGVLEEIESLRPPRLTQEELGRLDDPAFRAARQATEATANERIASRLGELSDNELLGLMHDNALERINAGQRPLPLLENGATDHVAAEWNRRLGTRAAGAAPVRPTSVNGIVEQAQAMYARTRAGLAAEATARGVRAPIAGAKRFVHGQDVQSFLSAAQAHFRDDPDGLLNFLDGMVLSSDPSDKARVLEGLDLLSRSGMPMETVFSDPGNKTAVILRNMLTDADGAINPAKTLLLDIAESGGDAATLAEIAGKRLNAAMGDMFPSVQEQLSQNRQFLKLLGDDPGAAKVFLEAHPAADQPVAQWMVRMATTHDTLQKWFYNPFRGVMSFAYMAISPAYWMRNRISNAVHIGIDAGLGTGLTAFWRGKKGAADDLVRMFGYLPPGARVGFGAAPEAPEAAKGLLGSLNRLAEAAADEKGMRQIMMRTVAGREFNKVLRPGVVIPLLDDFAPNLPEYERAILYQLARDNWGDARKALQQFYAMKGHGRNLGFATRTQQERLAGYGMLDGLRELLPQDIGVDEALRQWDNLMGEFDGIAGKAVAESPMLDLSRLGPLEREAIGAQQDLIQRTAGNAAADIFTRQVAANENAIDIAKAAANDMHRLAHREYTIRVANRLLAENNGKLPADVIWRQASEIAAREVDGVLSAFDGPIAQTNKDLIQRAEAFRQLAWNISEASGKKGANIRQLILNLGVPEGVQIDLSRGFRGWLWGAKGKRLGYYHQMAHEMWIARREAVIAAIEEKSRLAAQLAGVEFNTEAIRRADDALRLARLFDNARIQPGGLAYVLDEAGEKVPLVAPDDGFTPSGARLAYESKAGLRQLHGEVRELLAKAWTAQPAPDIPPGLEEGLGAWVEEGMRRKLVANLNIDDVATRTAAFALHEYPRRVGADLVAGYIYPFHYWYSRTYQKWIKRIVQHPEIIAAYARYRSYMEKTNAALPEWWRYNLRIDELPGVDLKHPLYFNLEATLNPLYGMVGTDFNDREKRVDWLSSVLDDLGKFGPTVWTPYTLALALAYHMQGKEEAAARWGGRLTQATGVVRDVTALLGVNQGKGVEIDPAILLFGGGMSPYERNRAGRELAGLMEEGVSEKDAIDAGYNQEGPIWDLAASRAINQRALGNIFSYFLGVGFKPRSESDVEIDRMYAHRNSVMQLKHMMSPEEYRQQWDTLRQAYPYMEAVLLARKGGDERDESFAWSVLGRIPPGMTDDVAEAMGLEYAVIQSFYDNKGLAGMPEGDRLRFMTAIAEMGAIMEAPSSGTRAEWNDAKRRNGAIYGRIEQMLGSDIWDRVDVYYGLKNEGNQDKAFELLDQDPEIELALSLKSMFIQQDPVALQYYGSIAMLDSYWRGRMYYEIEKEVGTDVWDQWTEYFKEAEGAARRAYWNSHPDLQRYVDIKAAWEPVIARKIVEFGNKIQETAPLFEGTPESTTQKALQAADFRRGLPQITASQWEDALGAATYRLVLDAARGETLPFRLQDKLEEVAVELGLPENAWLVVELVAASAVAPSDLR